MAIEFRRIPDPFSAEEMLENALMRQQMVSLSLKLINALDRADGIAIAKQLVEQGWLPPIGFSLHLEDIDGTKGTD